MLLYEKKRNMITVRLSGELDHSMAADVRAEVDELLLDPRIRRLVFDLNELEFMDSAGIGLILGRYKLMLRRGGSVAVSCSHEKIDHIFELAGLYQLVEKLA
ncbi:MAG: anti-sigma factor antagonist [Christensenellales bacterium]|nr:anti-sigma factor antagonist [Christensenellales bacterium]